MDRGQIEGHVHAEFFLYMLEYHLVCGQTCEMPCAWRDYGIKMYFIKKKKLIHLSSPSSLSGLRP